MRTRSACLGLVVLLLVFSTVLWTAPAAATELSEDLAARRERLMERLGPEAMLILFSAPVRNYSHDVDHEYRQDSNLYYLTGMTQDETMLVLMPGNASRREILFVRDRDPVREHWEGRLMSRDEAASHTGIRTVLSNREFEPFVAAMLSRQPFGGVDDREAAAFFGALAEGRARVAFALQGGGAAEPLTPAQDLARRIRERYPGFQTVDATPHLVDLRLVKTPYERALLVRSVEISNEGQRAGMRAARPGAYEYEVEAAIEAVHRARGAAGQSYPSIVGSGPNSTILHYNDSSRQMQAGELLLVDAGSAYQYMAADTTRTYPVSGRFTDAQKDLYELVLEAQEAGIQAARPGATFVDIHQRTVDVIRAGLLRLGLITDASGDQYRMWYTHGATHYIGIDVHDVGDRRRPLVPGMAFVIEPGVYIRQGALDALPPTAENLALIERIQPAVDRYRDTGVRIEDAFLLEESGLRRMTEGLPRTVAEVEAFMQARVPVPSAAR
jgi:Xaa-Pro aminopeptidase